jgi:outer membrane protein TolC
MSHRPHCLVTCAALALWVVTAGIAGEGTTQPAAEPAKPPAGQPPPPKAAPARPQHPLSLQDAIRRALQRNLTLAAEKLSPQQAATVVIEQKAAFDPTLGVELNRSKINEQSRGSAFEDPAKLLERLAPLMPTTTTTPGVSPTPAPTPKETELPHYITQQATGTVQVTERLTPGTSVEVFKDWTRDWDDRPSTGLSPVYSESLGLSLTQPLLRGFGVRVNTAAIATARNDQRIALAALHDVALTTAADTMKTYYELVYAIRHRELLLRSLERARNLQQDVKARVDAQVLGARDPSVAQAAAEVAAREEAIVVAEDAIRDAEDSLKVLADLVADPALWGAAITPTTEPSAEAAPVEVEQAVRLGLGRRPDFLAQKIAIENDDITIFVRRNELLPVLDLTAKAAGKGLGGEWQDSRHASGSLDHYELAAGVVFEYPLGNRAAKARLRHARLTREQNTLRLQALEQQIQLDVRRAVRQAETELERLRVTRLSVAAEEERLRAETIRLKEAGVGTAQDVLDAQAALADAQIRQLRALIDLNRARVDADRAQGILLEANQVSLEEAPPPK